MSRPPMTRSSSALSRLEESLPPGWMTGRSFLIASPKNGLLSSGSRARVQSRLPATVLISPLCAIMRQDCESGQVGKVFVL